MANKHKRRGGKTATPPLQGILYKTDEPKQQGRWVGAVAGAVILGLIYYRPEAGLQQDVYQSKADCQQDWQDEALCQESSSSGGSSSGGRWRGPAYYEDNREVETKNGRKIRPKTDRSSEKPVPVKGSVMDMASRPVQRGGFSFGGGSRTGG